MKILLFLMTFASSASVVSLVSPKKQSVVEKRMQNYSERVIDASDKVNISFSYDSEEKSNFENLNNLKISTLNLGKASNVYGSKYGPFIEASYENYSDFVNYDLPRLQKRGLLDSFNYSISGAVEPMTASDYYNNPDEKSLIPYAVALDQVGLSGSSFTGSGIKVGFVEPERPDVKDLSVFNGITYEILPSKDCKVSTAAELIDEDGYMERVEPRMYHGIATTSTTRGIASGVSIYLASSRGYDGDFVRAIEALVAKGVDVINISAGSNIYKGEYDGTAAYVDYISQTKGITFVTSAGNYNPPYSNYVGSPGIALNAITVGSSYKNTVSRFSSYDVQPCDYLFGVDDYDNYISKPDLVAPGEKLYKIPNVDPSRFESSARSIDGTSFSAPIVTGMVALLMEEFPSLKTQPGILKNALLASASLLKDGDYQKEGYGLVNYEAARMACKHYVSSVLMSGTTLTSPTKTISVPAGATATVSALTEHYPKIDSNTHDSSYYPTKDLRIVSPILKIKDNNGNEIDGIYEERHNTCVYKFTNTSTYAKTYNVYLNSYNTYEDKFRTARSSLNYYLDSEIVDVELKDTITYLDANPVFSFRPNDAALKNYKNPYISLRLHDSFGRIVKEYGFTTGAKAAGKYNQLTIGKNDWLKAIETTGRDIYISFAIRESDKSNLKFTKMKRIHEPTDYKNSVCIVPSDYKFASTGYLNSPGVAKDIVKNGLTVHVKGLRCAHIEQQFINLSPRHQDAGTAYLELTFDQKVYSFMFGVCFWNNKSLNDYLERNSETGRADFKCVVETKDANGVWSETFDIINDARISEDRNQVDRFETYCSQGIYGVRFYATGNKKNVANLSKNFGRVCIDDVVLNTNSSKTYSAFWTTFYSPITQKDAYVQMD